MFEPSYLPYKNWPRKCDQFVFRSNNQNILRVKMKRNSHFVLSWTLPFAMKIQMHSMNRWNATRNYRVLYKRRRRRHFTGARLPNSSDIVRLLLVSNLRTQTRRSVSRRKNGNYIESCFKRDTLVEWKTKILVLNTTLQKYSKTNHLQRIYLG